MRGFYEKNTLKATLQSFKQATPVYELFFGGMMLFIQ
jgi:hypothetical protein